MRLTRLQRKIERIQAHLSRSTIAEDYSTDPVGYARKRLRIPYIWSKQEEIARALVEHGKVLVKSGHSTGKTFMAAWLTNWFYDTHDPSEAMTTAPTKRDVEDLLWKEVRLQRMNAGLSNDFIGPTAPEMRTSPAHYAKGYTARKGESFQGRHGNSMLFVFDEAIGVESSYWTTTKTMFKKNQPGHYWLVICNPTDMSSQVYQEEQSGDWKVFELSSLDHPNIEAELRGEAPLIPAAVTLSQVRAWVNDWCTPIREDERQATDFVWEKKLYRPGPEMEARCFGRWPSQGTYSVWSDALWAAIENETPRVPILEVPQLGCDVARHGDDKTEFHVRWGACSFWHEAAQGWATTQTTGRCIELAREYAELCNKWRKEAGGNRSECTPQDIPLKIDDDGVGGGVTDRLLEQGYNAIAVRSGSTPLDPARYPNKRSELWFQTAGKAKAGLMGLGRLDAKTKHTLKLQAMAPTWKLDSAGRRVVEKKEETKDKIGRSPDGLDAFNLAYYDGSFEAPTLVDLPRQTWTPVETEGRARRKLYGR